MTKAPIRHKKLGINHSNRRYYNWLLYDICDRFLIRSIPYYKGTMYDFGCGETPYKSFFLKYVDQYIGIDWSDSMHNTNADIIANLNEPLTAVESNTADVVISLSVLEHLSEPQTMLNEAFRVLKPSGTLILQTPWQWWVHEAPYDFFRYSPYGLRYLLEKAGFHDISIEAQSGFFVMLFIKINYFSRRLIVGPRWLRNIVQIVLTPFWFINQMMALILDRLDHKPYIFASGYYTVAKKR